MKMPTLDDAITLLSRALYECDGQMHAAEWELNEYTLYELRNDYRSYEYFNLGLGTLLGHLVTPVHALPPAPAARSYAAEADVPVRTEYRDPRKVGHLALRVQQHNGGRWKYYDWEHNEDWMKR